jgi:hypothetical protein
MCRSRSAASIEVQHMASTSVDDPQDTSVRARSARRRRAAALVAAGLVVIGAFLLWGPIGLGNGPLTAAVYASQGWPDSGRVPVGFVIPFRNSGEAPAVIDGLDFIGGTRYPSPRVLRLEVLNSGNCGGTWPAHRAGQGFVLIGCGGTVTGPLVGRAVGPVRAFFGFPGAAEVAPPGPGTCWVMTKIVVHYHVGIRHYSASDPYELAVCASSGQVKSAMDAAQTAS